MALKYSFNRKTDSDLLENAIEKVLSDGVRTTDLITSVDSKVVSTEEMGNLIIKKLTELT